MIGVTYVYCKIWHCYCNLKNINNLYQNNFRGLGNDIRQGAWWPYNTRINHIQYHLTKGLIIFWNLFLELKMDKRYIYYLFFFCFNPFTITLLSSLHYIDVLFFLAVFKIGLLAHFSKFLKNYKSHQHFKVWSENLI
jgi:hypothetical protein